MNGFHTLHVLFSRMAVLWEQRKLFLEHTVAVSSDALHAVAGVVVMLLAAAIVRKPVSSVVPWLVAFAATLGNEFIDLWIQQWPKPAMQYGESVKDLVVTMALPTLMLLTARYVPSLYRPTVRRRSPSRS